MGVRSIPIYKLVPNLVTIFALCLGISAVRYALDEKFTVAAGLILIAAIMDSVDGRIARMLNCVSDFGAQLDSLADIVSFGVAPAMLAYLWSLHTIPYKGVGWAVVLFYITCNALRLARFNAELLDPDAVERGKRFFTGVPVTAAAALSTLPMVSNFELTNYHFSHWFVAVYMLVLGLLMVSRIPTFSGKEIEIPEQYVPILLVLGCLILTSVILEPWVIFPCLGLLYLCSIPISAVLYYYRQT